MEYNYRSSRLKNAIAILAFLIITVQGHAQDKTKAEEYALQAEQTRRAMLMRELDSGVYLMDNNDYAAAEVKFKYVLQNIKSVPSDLTYYFGKTSFHLGKYKQSIDWLNKYIQ